MEEVDSQYFFDHFEEDSSDHKEESVNPFSAKKNSGVLVQAADMNPTSLCGFISDSANDKNTGLYPSQGNSTSSNPVPERRKDPPELLIHQPEVVNLLSPPGSTAVNTVNTARPSGKPPTPPPPPPETGQASPDITELSDFVNNPPAPICHWSYQEKCYLP
jgi:hypothetical protein